MSKAYHGREQLFRIGLKSAPDWTRCRAYSPVNRNHMLHWNQTNTDNDKLNVFTLRRTKIHKG